MLKLYSVRNVKIKIFFCTFVSNYYDVCVRHICLRIHDSKHMKEDRSKVCDSSVFHGSIVNFVEIKKKMKFFNLSWTLVKQGLRALSLVILSYTNTKLGSVFSFVGRCSRVGYCGYLATKVCLVDKKCNVLNHLNNIEMIIFFFFWQEEMNIFW